MLRNQSSAPARPETLPHKPMGVVYSCVPAPRSHPLLSNEPQKHTGRSPTFEVHALAIYRSTKGVVEVNVTWPAGVETNAVTAVNHYVMLALSNYWPTSWVVVIPPWRQLGEVIVVGSVGMYHYSYLDNNHCRN